MPMHVLRVDRLIRGCLVPVLCGVWACGESAAPAPITPNITNASAQSGGRTLDAAAEAALLESMPLGRVVSRDAVGHARFMVGSPLMAASMPVGLNGEAIARLQLVRHARLLGLYQSAARSAQLHASQRLSGGAQLLQFVQRAANVEVFGARASVLLDVDRNLVALSNSLSPQAESLVRAPQFTLSAAQAVDQVYTHRFARKLPGGAVQPRGQHGDWADFAVASAPHTPRLLEVSAKRVLFPTDAQLVPAYHVEILARAGDGDETNAGFGEVVAADDGRSLWSASLTASDSFNYRVWADSRGVPTDGPLVDTTPHPTGMPDRMRPANAQPTLVNVEGLNSNPDGRSDPWLAPAAKTTDGNNVKAYSDRDQYVDDAGVTHRDGFNEGSDTFADLTAANTFDRVYDLDRAPAADDDQIKAAITQLFYVTNWMHDYWYDSGFNESAKNAQLSNYGRGGAEGDPLRAEAQDSANSGISNNANMSTFSDGRSPRMQMYVWSGLPNRSIVLEPPVNFEDGFGAAVFGPQTFSAGRPTLQLALADDDSTEVAPDGAGMGTTTDACQPPKNVKGTLAVVDRGACTFIAKVTNAQSAGASAVLLIDNAPGHTPPNPSLTAPKITIPVLSVSYEDGQKVKAALMAAGEGGSLTAPTFTRGEEVKRDGTIDNSVVAHEWGHYFHHRLVLCGAPSCDGMSEGWGDFMALMLAIRAGDVFDGKAYPLAQYATGGLGPNNTYFGIRRAPYSTDLSKNPFTFQHVRRMAKLPMGVPLASTSVDMAEVHNVGEIWASMLFEGYVNLLNAGQAAGRPFEESKRRMADYLVAGLKATPVEPSFVEQRDAILATVYALAKAEPSRMADFTALAQGFAKRGLGVGAVAPPTTSSTLNEAEESFAFKGDLTLSELVLDDSSRSCDRDGVLDGGESGKLTFKVSNAGWLPLSAAKIKVVSTDERVRFDNDGKLDLTVLEPYAEAAVSLGVTVQPGSRKRALMQLTLTAEDPDSVKATADHAFELLFNYDDRLGTASSDDVESERTAWLVSANGQYVVWSREGDDRNHFWHATDLGAKSDESLVSPSLNVSASNPLVISFSHRYAFETGPAAPNGPEVAFDGAVLEISSDGGTTWEDVSKYGDTGYVAPIYSTAAQRDAGADVTFEPDTNALAGRMAWAGSSAGYPNFEDVAIDLGDKFAGKTIEIRFRVGTDDGTGAPGWDIDRIAFGTSAFDGITNAPFAALRDDNNRCNGR